MCAVDVVYGSVIRGENVDPGWGWWHELELNGCPADTEIGILRVSMNDPIAAFVAARALGAIERRVPLRGRLVVNDGSEVAPSLLLTSTGLFIVGARDSTRGALIDLGARADLRLEPGRVQSVLRIGDQSFSVISPRTSSLEQAIALGRVRKPGRPRLVRPFSEARHVDRLNELERTWLDAWLGREEVLLGWLATTTTTVVPSNFADHQLAEFHLVLTDRRLACVALGPLGDALVEEVDPRSVTATLIKARLSVTVGSRVLAATRSRSDLFGELIMAAGQVGTGRLVEIARSNWVAKDPENVPFARYLLTRATERQEPIAPFLEWMVTSELEEAVSARLALRPALAGLRAADVAAEVFSDLYVGWQFLPSTGHALLAKLRAQGREAEPWALEFHTHLHEAAPLSTPNPERRALAAIALAEHSISADHRTQAIDVLENRLGELPSETLADMAPPKDLDLTTGAGGQQLRTRVFELLATAKGQPDLRSATELARLHPLVGERVRELAAVASGELQRRALLVVKLLEPGGLAKSVDSAVETGPVRALPERLMNEELRHPSAREGSPVLGKVQSLLANVPFPNLGMLRDYCEKLGDGRYPLAAQALRQAVIAFGVPGVQAYISQGVKGVGLRGYESEPPFVLIGGQHLEGGEYQMTAAELRFALGAEITHLRFGHTRVTSSEVWAGTWDKGRQGLDVALTLLPFLRGWELADKAMRATRKMKIPLVTRVFDTADAVKNRVIGPTLGAHPETPDELSLLNEQLVTTHRAMQLTADRAGLILSGDPQAAVRAVLLVRRDYATELRRAKNQSLVQLLGQRSEGGGLAHQDLAVRIASLLSFYLSDEYRELRAAILE